MKPYKRKFNKKAIQPISNQRHKENRQNLYCEKEYERILALYIEKVVATIVRALQNFYAQNALNKLGVQDTQDKQHKQNKQDTESEKNTHGPIMIATETIRQQQWIMACILPKVHEILKNNGFSKPFTYTLCKGKSHYLCLYRLEAFYHSLSNGNSNDSHANSNSNGNNGHDDHDDHANGNGDKNKPTLEMLERLAGQRASHDLDTVHTSSYIKRHICVTSCQHGKRQMRYFERHRAAPSNQKKKRRKRKTTTPHHRHRCRHQPSCRFYALSKRHNNIGYTVQVVNYNFLLADWHLKLKHRTGLLPPHTIVITEEEAPLEPFAQKLSITLLPIGRAP